MEGLQHAQSRASRAGERFDSAATRVRDNGHGGCRTVHIIPSPCIRRGVGRINGATDACRKHAMDAANGYPAPGYKNLVLISWILLGGCALLSVIPVIGCLSWVMFIPIFITTIVLGIITLSRGGTRDGVLILVASIVILPAFTLVVPILTTALLGKATEAGDRAKPRSSRITDASPAATATPRIASTIPPAATRPPGAPVMPNATAAKSMVNNTMLNFKNALNSADFEAFYRTQLSDLWKAETTPEQLKTTFKTFIDKKIDLSPIFFVDPVIEPAPYMDNNGMLVLKGHYPLQKEKVSVTYELTYSREAKWGLSGINVRTKPLSQ